MSLAVKPIYKKFNDAANQIFFNGRFADAPLYLDLESKVLSELSELVSIPELEVEDALCNAVLSTLDWSDSNIYFWHTQNTKAWRISDSNSAPPFTALLLVLSLAAERMREDGGFSSNNYYARLAELFDATNEPKLSSLRGAGKYTLEFWQCLNIWLRRFDNEIGIPTATAVHESWKYVSYALSQSLVRDGDKKRMHRMFSAYRLAPGDSVSPSEMSLYLDEWLSHAHAPSWLRRLWENAELREKVAQSASEELQRWEGKVSVDDGAFTKSSACKWVAIRKTFPKKKILFYTTVKESLFSENASLRLQLENHSFSVGLQNLAGTEESFILIPSELSLKALFGQNFELSDENTDVKAVSHAKPVIALCKADDGNHYREISRVRSHRPHLILCHTTWRQRVEKHLRRYANPVMTCSDTDQGSGIPSDWICFSEVIFDKPVDPAEIDNQIQILAPFAELPSVQPIGGLKLSHGIWHADAAPNIVVPCVIKESELISIKKERAGALSELEVVFEEAFGDFSGDIIERLPFELAGLNLNISAGSTIRELNLSFRTADNAKRKLLIAPKRLFWSIRDAGALVGPTYDPSSSVFTEGLQPSDSLLEVITALPVWAGSLMLPSEIPKASSSDFEINVNGGSYIAAECILRSYHYWICEPYLGPETTNSRLVICKDCGSRVVLPEPKRSGFRRSQSKLKTTRKIRHTLAPEIHIGRPHVDTLIDAICYKSEGSWEVLRGLISSVCDTPSDIGEYARRLSDIGLIDLSRDIASGSIIGWVVPPPALVLQSDSGKLMLTGFRSSSLINKINAAISICAEYAPVSLTDSAITIHFWKVTSPNVDDLGLLLDDIKDPFGRKVRVVIDPARKILSVCPALSALEELLPEYHLDSSSRKEFFDLSKGRWSPVEEKFAAKSGAYRIKTRGNMYFFSSREGSVKRGTFEVVKTLAARDAGIYLHHYDIESFSFKCVLGVDVPPLLSRCLVIASGSLPYIRDGLIHYPNVTPEIANAVLYKLYC